jgi:hypothetical protein
MTTLAHPSDSLRSAWLTRLLATDDDVIPTIARLIRGLVILSPWSAKDARLVRRLWFLGHHGLLYRNHGDSRSVCSAGDSR